MKKKHILFFAAFLFLLLGSSSLAARAEQTKERLFTLFVNDGSRTVKIPVSELRDTDTGKLSIQAEPGTIQAARSAGRVTIKVKKQTAYFRQNYKSVSVKKRVNLSASTRITVKATAKGGKKYSCRLTVQRPSIPKISSLKFGSSVVTVPGDVLKAVVRVKADPSDPLTFSVKIKNSRKKVVYSAKVGTAASSSFQFYWDGTASTGNKAGYSAGASVDAGTYQLTATIQYTDGTKKKSLSKTKSFTVKEAPVQIPTASAMGQSAFSSNPWPWKVMLSGNKTVDYLAEVILRSIITPEMTEYQRAYAIYKYMCTHYIRWKDASDATGAPEKVEYSSAAAKANIKAYQATTNAMLASGKAVINKTDNATPGGFGSGRYKNAVIILSKQMGVCFHGALGLEILLRHAGMDADILHNAFTDYRGHFWSMIKVDGVWYMGDVGMEGIRVYQGATFGASHFLRGRSTMNKVDDQVLHSTIDPAPQYQKAYAMVSDKDHPARGK